MVLENKKILIVGAGSFGTALASCIVSPNNHVVIAARNDLKFKNFQSHPKLKDCRFQTFDEFDSHPAQFDLVILAVPCQSIRAVSHWLKTALISQSRFKTQESDLCLVSAAKGIEQETLMLPDQILQDVFGSHIMSATLSGPSFAKEMLEGLPTCMVFASKHSDLQKRAAEILHSSHFRIYSSSDVVGVELGGALKNVISMVAGCVDGLKLGNNARAAVITRGLGEIAKIGMAMGADPMTFLGLSGVGDLILSCTSDLSRNRQFGFRLSQGESQSQIIDSMHGVVEGVTTAQSAHQLCQKLGVSSSVLHMAYCVLYEGMPIRQAVHSLINKEQGGEFHWIKK